MNTTDLDLLLQVIRHGSFAGAARELNLDPSSVSRSVAALEDELGVRLFQRSTRQLALTEAGSLFAARIEPLLEEFRQARLAATDAGGEVRGVLRLSVSNTFGLRCIVPLLPAFCQQHPALQIDLVLSDAQDDLLAQRIDLAVRLGALHDSSLVALPLRRIRYRVVAAPAWLAARGQALTEPAALSDCGCLCFPLAGFRDRWRFSRIQHDPGQPSAGVTVAIHPRLIATNGLALRECALAGLGPALLPDWLIDADLAAGTLVDLFADHEVSASDAPSGAWLVYPSRSYVPAKVRVFIDFLRQALL